MNKIFYTFIFLVLSCGAPKLRLTGESCQDTQERKCIDRISNFEAAESIGEKLKQKYERLNLNCNFQRVISVSGVKKSFNHNIMLNLLDGLTQPQEYIYKPEIYIVDLEEQNLKLHLETVYTLKFKELDLFEGIISDLSHTYELARSFTFNLSYESSYQAKYFDELNKLVEEIQYPAFIEEEKIYEISVKELENTDEILDHGESVLTLTKCSVEAKIYPAFIGDFKKD